MLSPKKCFEDFKGNVYQEESKEFLNEIYLTIFKEIGKSVSIPSNLIKEVEILKGYFNYLYKLVKKKELKSSDYDKFLEAIDEKELKKAVSSFEKIRLFILSERTNINGLLFLWILNCTKLEDLEQYNFEKIEEVLSSQTIFWIISSTPLSFFIIILNDLIIPLELINPTRRKGGFDKKIFEKISKKLKETIPSFNYRSFESESKQEVIRILKNSSNWLIDERISKHIELTVPERGKFIDFVLKVEDILFMGAHKEQQGGGGAQDNQARDANRVFIYRPDEIKKIEEEFGVRKIYFCIMIEGNYNILSKSRHWKDIFREVEDKSNEDKYLLNSFQFIKLINSI